MSLECAMSFVTLGSMKTLHVRRCSDRTNYLMHLVLVVWCSAKVDAFALNLLLTGTPFYWQKQVAHFIVRSYT